MAKDGDAGGGEVTAGNVASHTLLFDATGLVEYYPNYWVDLTGEVTLGSTSQTDDIRSNELTLRLGRLLRRPHVGHTRHHDN
mgnify:CR=1 FL=1